MYQYHKDEELKSHTYLIKYHELDLLYEDREARNCL